MTVYKLFTEYSDVNLLQTTGYLIRLMTGCNILINYFYQCRTWTSCFCSQIKETLDRNQARHENPAASGTSLPSEFHWLFPCSNYSDKHFKIFFCADNEKLLHVRPAVWTLVVNLSTDKENTVALKTLYQYEQQLQIKYLI